MGIEEGRHKDIGIHDDQHRFLRWRAVFISALIS